MVERPVDPMAAAMQWVSRIFAAAMMMVLPGVAGFWLDQKLGVGFIGLVGFAFGLVGGMAYLIAATRSKSAKRRTDKSPPEVDPPHAK